MAEHEEFLIQLALDVSIDYPTALTQREFNNHESR